MVNEDRIGSSVDDLLAAAYYNRGVAYYNQNDIPRMCRDFEKACRLGDCEALEWAKKEGYCR